MYLKTKSSKRGFSLIELLVSVSILSVITTIVLVQHSQFSGNILLGNLAYDVALSMRQAQVFGLSVREVAAGSGEFGAGYGVHFDADDPFTYVLFADRNGNRVFESVTEVVEVYTIRQGNSIARFCGVLSNGVEKCSTSDLETLSIIFERPDPDAIMRSDVVSDVYSSATIVLGSLQGEERTVRVALTGQISVEQEL